MRIGGTNGVNGPRGVYGKMTEADRRQSGSPTPQGDRVDLSDTARLSGAIAKIPDIRTDKVARAREMIASGELDTPEHMDIALERMLEDVLGWVEVE